MLKVRQAGNLARGVPGDGQFQIGCGYAAPVVLHADKALPAVFKANVDLRGIGVKAVFNQFLEHAGRALHHFTSGDLIAQLRR